MTMVMTMTMMVMMNLVVGGGGAVERAGGGARPALEPEIHRFSSCANTIKVSEVSAVIDCHCRSDQPFHLCQCPQQAKCSDATNPPSTNQNQLFAHHHHQCKKIIIMTWSLDGFARLVAGLE